VVAINPNNYKVGWVSVAYARSIFNLTNELALQALNYFLLGTSIWVYTYIFFRLVLGTPKNKVDVKPLLANFLVNKKTAIISLYAIVVIATFYISVGFSARYAETGNLNVATTGVSYLLFLPFALGGIIILMFLIYRGIDYNRDPTNKLIFLALIATAAVQSYNPGSRFNFLSWSVALVFVIVRQRTIWFKTMIYSLGVAGGLIAFAYAGLSRTPNAFLLSFDDQVNLAVERIASAEDQNLLDGFMMALQVYPENLNYQMGFQHLEIFLRPIPRKLWPDKPLGGYANKLGLNDIEGNNGLTVGISESIYGTFYGEGGVNGIILLSFLYGLFFAIIIYRSERFESDMRYVIKGLVIASLIVLIRGGDLAGIVAFIGMSYWPVFIASFQYGGFIRKFNLWYAEALLSRRFARLTDSQTKVDA
jgi:oligosaccharide repeat unit polymerase